MADEAEHPQMHHRLPAHGDSATHIQFLSKIVLIQNHLSSPWVQFVPSVRVVLQISAKVDLETH